jgi:hypothetical protein
MGHMSGISRRKTDWLVRVVYVNKKPKYQKGFPDSMYGGVDGAMAAAIAYRDECLATGDTSRPRSRWEKTGFITELSSHDVSLIQDTVEKHINKTSRYRSIASDLEISEIVQSVCIAIASKPEAEITCRRLYISIVTGLAARSLFFNKEKRLRKYSSGLDGF